MIDYDVRKYHLIRNNVNIKKFFHRYQIVRTFQIYMFNTQKFI